MKITVCTLTYNRFKDLENLIKSYLTLSYADSELLIIDDLGSKQTENVVKRWQLKDERIRYHKNIENLGFSRNLKQSYGLARGEVIVFMGDDDVFLDPSALDLISKAFQDKKVGVVKGAQLLYKNGKVNQAYNIPTKLVEIAVFDAGQDTYRNIWFESLSITGLAFRICPELLKSINDQATLYPQFEHMGVLCLDYKSASINEYIVGVQSHEGQLNCISYELDGKKTTLIDDWLGVYERIARYAHTNDKPFITKYEFQSKLAKFIPIFFPYSRLTSGVFITIFVILRTISIYPIILFYPAFLASCIVSIFLPNRIIKWLIEWVKANRLKKIMRIDEVNRYNLILSQYY